MKYCIMILIFAFASYTAYQQVIIKRQASKIKSLEAMPYNHYRSNLTREEMKEALTVAVSDSICLFIPGDTSVMPYLNKAKKEVELQGEYVRR